MTKFGILWHITLFTWKIYHFGLNTPFSVYNFGFKQHDTWKTWIHFSILHAFLTTEQKDNLYDFMLTPNLFGEIYDYVKCRCSNLHTAVTLIIFFVLTGRKKNLLLTKGSCRGWDMLLNLEKMPQSFWPAWKESMEISSQ